MAKFAEELLSIDLQLRYALFGLECALGVSFSGAEWQRVFRDADEDLVSAKQYLFYRSPLLCVTGRVDAYEPESIWLRIEGVPACSELLHRAVEGARHAALRDRSVE